MPTKQRLPRAAVDLLQSDPSASDYLLRHLPKELEQDT